jgi:hypothetical protein
VKTLPNMMGPHYHAPRGYGGGGWRRRRKPQKPVELPIHSAYAKAASGEHVAWVSFSGQDIGILRKIGLMHLAFLASENQFIPLQASDLAMIADVASTALYRPQAFGLDAEESYALLALKTNAKRLRETLR